MSLTIMSFQQCGRSPHLEANRDWCSARSSKPLSGGESRRWWVRFPCASAIFSPVPALEFIPPPFSSTRGEMRPESAGIHEPTEKWAAVRRPIWISPIDMSPPNTKCCPPRSRGGAESLHPSFDAIPIPRNPSGLQPGGRRAVAQGERCEPWVHRRTTFSSLFPPEPRSG
jgi:hypothetical protein